MPVAIAESWLFDGSKAILCFFGLGGNRKRLGEPLLSPGVPRVPCRCCYVALPCKADVFGCGSCPRAGRALYNSEVARAPQA